MGILVKLFILLMILLSPSVIFAHSQTQVIEMTSNGFSPDTVTVDQNATVIFLNKDTKDRWPASNVHPTHELYPEFDPRKPLEPGESWPFKIKKIGEWKYHDHLSPHIRGSLIVTSEGLVQNKASSWQQNFKNLFLQLVTKIKSFFSLAKKENAQKNWENLKLKFKGQAGSSGDIHDQAHLAGSLLYKEKGFSGIGICSQEFAFGCFHGFLDEAFKKDLSKLNEALDACSKLGPQLSGPVASCIHGIGHGVASFHGTSDLKSSLSSCRKLENGQEYCFDGVLMEFVRSAPDSFFKKDDPLYPCNALEQEFGYAYSQACGRNQPPLLMSRFKMGFDEVIGVCIASPSRPFKQSCFDSLGFSLASSGDVNQIISGCQKIGTAEFISTCIKSAAGELIFQEVPGWENMWQQVCNSGLDAEGCLENGQRLIKEYGRIVKISFDNYQRDEDPNSYIRNQLKKCYSNGGRDGCYKQAAEVLFNSFGLKETLKLLRDNEGEKEVYARCHEVTHYLSRLEYEKEDSISKVYAQCDSTCHGGCYHGTLEAYLKKEQDQTGFNLTSQFPKVCGKPDDYQKPLEHYECLHGMGHAAMFVTDMELKESLSLCDSLGEQGKRERCYTGVFMENSSSSTSDDHASIYIKKDDPFYPCNALEEKYQALCWQYQSSYFSIISKQDWGKVSQMCLQIPQQYQDRCFRTIGTNQVGFTQSITTMKDDCNLMPSDHFKDICVGGVVSSFAYRFVGDAQKMVDFCTLVDAQNQETCFKQMGTGLLDWSSDKDLAKRNCAKISNQNGYSWCMSAI